MSNLIFTNFFFLQGKDFNSTKSLNYAATNVISSLMFGRRFDYKDRIFQAMVERDNEIFRLTGIASLWVWTIQKNFPSNFKICCILLKVFHNFILKALGYQSIWKCLKKLTNFFFQDLQLLSLAWPCFKKLEGFYKDFGGQ